MGEQCAGNEELRKKITLILKRTLQVLEEKKKDGVLLLNQLNKIELQRAEFCREAKEKIVSLEKELAEISAEEANEAKKAELLEQLNLKRIGLKLLEETGLGILQLQADIKSKLEELMSVESKLKAIAKEYPDSILS